jgi:signal transduction histidine kinase
MATLRLPRVSQSRTQSLVAILLLTVGLAAFLAYEAWDAAQSHVATAKHAIRDYAKFAAWEFSVSAKEALYETLVWTFSPVASVDAGPPGEELPPPSVLAQEKFAHLLCANDSSRYHFRLDLRSGALMTSGDTPSLAMRTWISDTVPKSARGEYKSDWSYAVISGSADGRARTIVYQLRRDSYNKPAVAYGFELCLTQFAAAGMRKIMERYQLLPPSLTRGAPSERWPNDSLFSVIVRDGGGNEIYRSPVQYSAEYSGEYGLPAFGGLKTSVSLNPDVASALLIGGLPTSRLPLLLGVLALTMALAAIGLTRLRSDFIASVSHELRTPLAQVRMFAETLLLGRVRNEDERMRSLQIVDQEARRLTHLVENILQFSRAERRAIRLAPVPLELAGQVQEALEMFAPIARARRVALVTQLHHGIVATVDPGAFRQILLNLLDNAVKYGPGGQTVTVTLTRLDGHARLVVDDQGPGIDVADRSRVWEAFYRLEGAINSAVAGSGIGLSVVAELVALHQGRGWIENAPGGGARFVVELPVSRVADGESGIGNRESQTEPPGHESAPVGSDASGAARSVTADSRLPTPDSR